jgi:pimeloyl-ACP methyl ester carboxylesterase
MPVAADIYYFHSKLGGGDSLPVVLIHGAGGTHLHWPSDIRRLPELRVYAVDLPGHGKSGHIGLQSIDAYTDSILAWMEAIKLHRAAFVGHSMGGAIALTLAKKNAEHVLGLGLISTGARLRVNPVIMENAVNSQTFPTVVSFITSKSFSKHADPHLVELATKRMHEIRPSVLYGDFISCDNFNMMEALDTIRTPTLIVCGQDDEMTPLRYSQYLKDHIKDSRIVVIPDAGHMVMLEKQHMLSQALGEFFRNIRFQPGKI